ncbi:MAG: hypothetical protein R3Y56_02145 [Akkermansia sp.]
MKSSHLLLALSLCAPAWSQTEVIAPEIDLIFERYCQIAQNVLPILKGVTDKATAETAAPLLKQQLVPLYLLKKDFAKIGTLPADSQQAISNKYEQKMRASWGDVYAEIYRLQKAQAFASIPFAQQLQAYCTLLNQ